MSKGPDVAALKELHNFVKDTLNKGVKMSDVQKKLDEPIPRDVISTRSGGGNKQLSYLETWYVIDRLNQILGTSGWSNEIRELKQLPGDGRPSYMAVTRIAVVIDGKTVIKDGVGFGNDKSDHNAHELAMKEAVSDSFKVAAKNLGRSMGLALYDRTQEYISEVSSKTSDTDTTSNLAGETGQILRPRSVVTQSNGGGAKSIVGQQAKQSRGVDPRVTIKSAYNVLTAQRKITKEEFQAKFLNNKATKDLTDNEAIKAVSEIGTAFPELNL